MFGISKGSVPKNSTSEIMCHTAFLIVAIPGTANACLMYPKFATTDIETIGGVMPSGLSVTKVASSVNVTITNNSSAAAKYMVISLY